MPEERSHFHPTTRLRLQCRRRVLSSKTPLELLAIGYWYEDFEQVSEEEVAQLIERSRGAKVGETRGRDT